MKTWIARAFVRMFVVFVFLTFCIIYPFAVLIDAVIDSAADYKEIWGDAVEGWREA